MAKTKKQEVRRLLPDDYPLFIKYMGSKTKIMRFVVSGIEKVHSHGPVCDLFAGTASLSGAIGRQLPIISNDIQSYSQVLAEAYLNTWRSPSGHPTSKEIISSAQRLVTKHKKHLPAGLSYDEITSRREFNAVDKRGQQLLAADFSFKWHLFVRYYSGTWWSAEQCLWIDSLRQVAERYVGHPSYPLIMASLMHAMIYSSQGTGHFAQYRDAKTSSAMKDIAIYRKRSLKDYFARKYDSVTEWLPRRKPRLKHEVSTMGFEERLSTLPRCTVYADPPYCFVHYSRFYHLFETVVRYDYPPLQVINGQVVKGRYRDDRHQSPFCIRTKVHDAFRRLFDGVQYSKSNLVLSYCNTGMISLDDLLSEANTVLGSKYKIKLRTIRHVHMTMGRKNDRHRNVKECLVLAWRK